MRESGAAKRDVGGGGRRLRGAICLYGRKKWENRFAIAVISLSLQAKRSGIWLASFIHGTGNL